MIERITLYRRRNLYSRVVQHLKQGAAFAVALAAALFDRRRR